MDKICVIIPGKGDHQGFDQCVQSLIDLNYPSMEIIFVDDGLDKRALDILRKYPDAITIINNTAPGPSHARNLAAHSTNADYLAFTDADCIVDRNWLQALKAGFANSPQAVACGGVQQLPQDATRFQQKVYLLMQKIGFITDYMQNCTKIRATEHNPSCNVMYKRDIFVDEGGFAREIWPGEDVEFDYRLRRKNHLLIINPQAVVYHYRPNTLTAFAQMMYRYGKAQGWLVARHGLFRKIHWAPVIGALGCAILALLLLNNAFVFLIIVAVIVITPLVHIRHMWCWLLFWLTIGCWHCGFVTGLFCKSLINQREQNARCNTLQ